MSTTNHPDFEKLRKHFDGDDQFMRGHQPMKLRQAPREHSLWMGNSAQIKAFLLQRFPLTEQPCQYGGSDDCRGRLPITRCLACRHKLSAQMWAYVIHSCFLMGETSSTAAAFWNRNHGISEGTNPPKIRRIVQMIRLAEAGERLDGKPRSFGKAGRPRKTIVAN